MVLYEGNAQQLLSHSGGKSHPKYYSTRIESFCSLFPQVLNSFAQNSPPGGFLQ